MASVFKLQGADVYEVLETEHLPGPELAPPSTRSGLLGAVCTVSTLLAAATDLSSVLDEVLAVLDADLGITHSMVMLIERNRSRLFTVASRGYPASGVGSEIPLGHGIIGVAAREGTSIRISHGTSEYAYSRIMRERAQREGLTDLIETEIPLPGLAAPGSQLAVPLRVSGCTVGVLFAESADDARFSWEDEDALVAIASQLGTTIALLQQAADAGDDAPAANHRPASPRGTPLAIRHYPADNSVFIGDDYLIKGVAGSIFRKLVRDYLEQGRTDFTNRELRLDSSIRLPDITDNLEARLILLVRRLQERGSEVRIEKTGRGRFRLSVDRPLTLVEAG
jgi:adenylate cyclase